MNLELTGNKLITGTKPKWKFQSAITAYANFLKSMKLPVKSEQQVGAEE